MDWICRGNSKDKLDQDFSRKILSGLSRLRSDDNFCDIELFSTEGRGKRTPVRAHRWARPDLSRGERKIKTLPSLTRNILAAASPYFHAMFTSGLIESEFDRTARGKLKHRQRVVLQGIQQPTLEVRNFD